MKKFLSIFLVLAMALSFAGCKHNPAEVELGTTKFNWYETPVVLPEGTDGTYGTEGTYVYFGVWPQDVVPQAEEATLGLENSTEIVTRGYMDFVKGSDGNYYVKCAENAFKASYTYTKDGTKVGEGGKNSRWFKVMPIKWRVVDTSYDVDGDTGSETGNLLVAENILTSNVPFYENNSDNRYIDSKTVYPNNYMHSQIRAYLNGITYVTAKKPDKWENNGFLQTAFGAIAQQTIITTKVNNAKDQMSYDGTHNTGESKSCAPTDDKIFLLSEREVVQYSKEPYDSKGEGNSRIRLITDFALANEIQQYLIGNDYSCNWWLRSPYYNNSTSACLITYEGLADQKCTATFQPYYGVVPALTIKL